MQTILFIELASYTRFQQMEKRKRKAAEHFSPSVFSVPLAPEFHPTEDEFRDAVKYIESIEPIGARQNCNFVHVVPAKYSDQFIPDMVFVKSFRRAHGTLGSARNSTLSQNAATSSTPNYSASATA